MPIEVRELVIKAVIEQEGGSAASGRSAAGVSGNGITQQEETIKMCVEKVLEILRERDER